MQTVQLLTDTHSKGKGMQLYGKKNDKVTVVSWHDDVAIVEAVNKNRFSVRKENLKILSE